MKLFVKVKPKAREERVEKTDETHFIVHTKEYFSLSKSKITIVSGHKARTKIIIIEP